MIRMPLSAIGHSLFASRARMQKELTTKNDVEVPVVLGQRYRKKPKDNVIFCENNRTIFFFLKKKEADKPQIEISVKDGGV